MLFLNLFRAKNLFYYYLFCYETSTLKDTLQTEMLQMLSKLFSFFLEA